MNDATQFFDTTGGGGGPPQPPSAYNIERSVRFNSADSSYLSQGTTRSPSSNSSLTISFWIKLASLTTDQQIISSVAAGSYFGITYFGSYTSGELWVIDGSTQDVDAAKSNGVLRDPSAWYHIVYSRSHGGKGTLYINGTAQTKQTANNSSADIFSSARNIGRRIDTGTRYCSCYLADFFCIDGQALTPTSFGEFDTNGVWQPKAYTGTYGTNGFHLPFSDNSTAAALGTDTSGNGNDWTVNNLVAGPSTTANSWSGYFDGSGDYLTSTGSGYALGAGDYTVEAWVYLNSLSLGAILCTGTSPASDTWQIHQDNGTVVFYPTGTTFITGSGINLNTWHHVAATRSGSTVRLFIDGVLKSSTTNSTNLTNTNLRVGLNRGGSSYFNGYISNVRIVKGTAVYTSNFTPPTAPLTAITNTSLLTLQDSTFIDNSPNNFTITANGNTSISTISPFEEPTATDSLVDTPTNYGTDTGAGGEVRGNYATLNPLNQTTNPSTVSQGNLYARTTATNWYRIGATIFVSSGKWYWEYTPTELGLIIGGVGTNEDMLGAAGLAGADKWLYYNTGTKFGPGVYNVAYGASYTVNDVIGVALDMDAGTLTFYKNGVSQGTAFTGLVGHEVAPAVELTGYGGGTNTGAAFFNFGQRPFTYTAPSGYKALCTQNLPTPTIADGSSAMDVVTYSGNSSSQTISGLNFSPDLVWIKSRSTGYNHAWNDTVRGALKLLSSSMTDAEYTDSTGVNSFTSDGWTFNGAGYYSVNQSGHTYVAWTWDAGSSTVTNTDGSITSQVRANPSAGFSVVTATCANGTNSYGHGLGVKPAMYIVKNRSISQNWQIWHQALSNETTAYLQFTTAAQQTYSTMWAASTSTTISLVGGGPVPGGDDFVAYVFAPVAGYSAFGSYTGNGSADGPFVYTGFRPRWVLFKRYDASAYWGIYDAARNTYNAVNLSLYPNDSLQEFTDQPFDFLSNGFKVRGSAPFVNSNTATYIYAAFAEHPFQYSRAR